MKIQMEFDLPFPECEKCFSFSPVVEDRHYEMVGYKMTMTRKLTCKGYKFCEYLKENVIGGNDNGK